MVKTITPFKLEADYLKFNSIVPTDKGYTLTMRTGDELIELVQQLEDIIISPPPKKKGLSSLFGTGDDETDTADTAILQMILPFYSETFINTLTPLLTKHINESEKTPKQIEYIFSDDKITNYDHRIKDITSKLESLFEESNYDDIHKLIRNALQDTVYLLPLTDLEINPSISVNDFSLNLNSFGFNTEHDISFNLNTIPFYGTQKLYTNLMYLNEKKEYIKTPDTISPDIHSFKTYIELIPESQDMTLQDMFDIIKGSDHQKINDIRSQSLIKYKYGIESIQRKGFISWEDEDCRHQEFYDEPHLENIHMVPGRYIGLMIEITSYAKHTDVASKTIKDIIIEGILEQNSIEYKYVKPYDIVGQIDS